MDNELIQLYLSMLRYPFIRLYYKCQYKPSAIQEMHDAIREVQKTNRFILCRIEQIAKLTESDNIPCTCTCGGENRLKETIKKVQLLEERTREIDDKVKTVDYEMDLLQSEFEEIRQLNSNSTEQSIEDVNSDTQLTDSEDELKERTANNESAESDNLGLSKFGDSSNKTSKTYATEADDEDMASVNTAILTQQEVINNMKNAKQTETSEKRFVTNRRGSDHNSPVVEHRTSVTVIEQKEKKCLRIQKEWDMLGDHEYSEGLRLLHSLDGVHSVICVDISASMANGDAWDQATTFFYAYIKGLEHSAAEHGLRNEHVALVTFGHTTKVVERLTNDLGKIKRAFGNIQLGGPSPMYGGIMMAIAAVESSLQKTDLINNIQVASKIILITDGEPTNITMFAGPDVANSSDQEQAKTAILTPVEKMQGYIDLLCVPVGKANVEFLQLLASVADGKMLSFKDGHKLSRRLYLTMQTNYDPLGLGLRLYGSMFMTDSNKDLTESDKEQIQEIQEDSRKRMFSALGIHGQVGPNMYAEINSETLPEIGSRIRRGPDWSWNEQDSHGPGTVIGHEADQQVWIEWDTNAHQNVYRYGGSSGRFDVLLVDEPRRLQPGGNAEVGCVVKPGPHWKDGYSSVKIDDCGIVIKKLRTRFVQVRWKNGKRGDYLCGENNVFEVEISQTVLSSPTRAQNHPHETLQHQKKQNKNKNKNKNVTN